MADLLSIERALARVLERCAPLGDEDVALQDAVGRLLAEDAIAAVDLPPFRSSAMDGYAVRAADTPGVLPVSSSVAAGMPSTRALAAGEAVRISTGGVVPEGADAVVPVEDVVEHENAAEVAGGVGVGLHVRPVGGDVAAGDVIVKAGTRLAPVQIGALAAAGVARVACRRRPRVSLLATGSELVEPGDSLGRGEIYESNGPMLASLVESAGADVRARERVRDDVDAHRIALGRALQSDVVVTSGGVSVGPHDYVRQTLRELEVEEVFWGVAVKPGKPLAFGVRGRTLVFGLPGNPVSSLVGAELFIRPALLALQGATEPGPRWYRGSLVRAVPRNPARDELVRAIRLDDSVLEPLSGQESHMIVRAASADALVLVPGGHGEIAAGEPVRYITIGV